MVGVFALVAFLLLVLITINLKQFFFFSRTYTVNVRFKEVSGLDVGAPVYVYGVVAGEVKKIEYVPEKYPVKVVITLREKIEIYKNSSIRIITAGLIGETKMEIDAGTPDHAPVEDGDTVYGADMIDLYQTLSMAPQIVEDTATTLHALRQIVTEQKTQTAFKNAIQRFGSLSTKIDDLLTTTSSDIRVLTTTLRESSTNLERLIEETREMVSELQLTVDETRDTAVSGFHELTRDISQAGSDVSAASKSVEKTSDEISLLLNNQQQNLSRTLTNLAESTELLSMTLRRIESGEGTLGKIVQDETAYRELLTSLKELNEILRGLTGKGAPETIEYERGESGNE